MLGKPSFVTVFWWDTTGTSRVVTIVCVSLLTWKLISGEKFADGGIDGLALFHLDERSEHHQLGKTEL